MAAAEHRKPMPLATLSKVLMLSAMVGAGRALRAPARGGMGRIGWASPRGGGGARLRMSADSWPVSRVRSKFIEYFSEKRDHTFYKSSPVVPYDDPTLLFANAGMNQFKPIFVGKVEPSSPLAPLKRAANSQKCIRAGGKHNDLDDVGMDVYHHTFFEMLGSWSFGDYFKKEAIDWAWELLVREYGLPEEQIYASYFGGDEALGLEPDLEARDLWLQYLPAERVLPFDKKDNFWEMGDTGPCGPCSEVHFDRIGGRDASALVNADDPMVVEIWNLVFMQYFREDAATLKPLPNKHIDTGMGLERVASILQGKTSNYDTDAFTPILKEIQALTGARAYEGKLGDEDPEYIDTAYRVLADHARTLAYALADGAVPSNEGRGYVLRRVLRRALRYGKQFLNAPEGFFSALVGGAVIDAGKDFFPELQEKREAIVAVVREEEESFQKLLDRGLQYFEQLSEAMEAEKRAEVTGEEAFYLYDTLGFPVDLTEIMAAERGYTLDAPGFEACMAEQKERSRQAQRLAKAAGGALIELSTDDVALLSSAQSPTDDAAKYTWDAAHPTTVAGLVPSAGAPLALSPGAAAELKEGDRVGLLLDSTSFYAESGGQVADVGTITLSGGAVVAVSDAQSFGGFVLHVGSVVKAGAAEVGAEATCEVDYGARRRTAPNHTMTHVLNFALREVLQEECDQKGSYCDAEKLRFDFAHGKALSGEQIAAVEERVQSIIEEDLRVQTKLLPLSTATAIAGLRAVFGETYPDPVRVVTVGGDASAMAEDPEDAKWESFSTEFCGGTHISSTSDAGAFVLTEETAVAKGVRRVVAITGDAARAAREAGEDLRSRVEEAKAAAEDDVDGAERDAQALRQELDAASVSAGLKAGLRSQLEGLAKEIAGARKKMVQRRADEAVAALRQQLEDCDQDFWVGDVDIGANGKALQPLLKQVAKHGKCILGFSPSDDGDKCLVFANCPKDAPIAANDWAKVALDAMGGRGGGSPQQAQGNAPNDEAARAAAVEAANAFAAEKLAAGQKA